MRIECYVKNEKVLAAQTVHLAISFGFLGTPGNLGGYAGSIS